MLFNSSTFFIFLFIVFTLYWTVFRRNLRWQNILIMIASYVFYGWWDWRFLSLIILSSVVDYTVGWRMHLTEGKRKRLGMLMISLTLNLGLLGFFKYFNFFIDSWNGFWSAMGITMDATTLNIILPVGISFYTFQTLSYTIDIYRKQIEPTKDFIAFFAFVAFFPQLVAGPIERASNMIPQFLRERHIQPNDLVTGSRKILWGLFKKVVVADNLAVYVQQVYSHPGEYNGLAAILGTVFFAVQIYCDFSGYSDIAIGTARFFGFELMVNFRMPYFSKSIREFWGRWHISLSTWFRDYVYIPLGGNRVSMAKWQRNLMITFVVSGFWHGANWTFIIWGFIHGLFNSIEAMLRKWNLNIKLPDILSRIYLLLVVGFSWVFFRAASLKDALVIIKHSLQWNPSFGGVVDPYTFVVIMIAFGAILFFESGSKVNLLNRMYHSQTWFRWSIDYAMIFLIILFAKTGSTEFIYFQF